MSKPIRLSISYNEHIRFSYRVDKFNQCLHVRLAMGVPEDFRKDAISEAYEHYNDNHPGAEFIHPSAIHPCIIVSTGNPSGNWLFDMFKNEEETLHEIDFQSPEAAKKMIDAMDSPKSFEVWMEGYTATGEHQTAHKLGIFEAENFKEACMKAMISLKWDLKFYNEKCNSYWACGFYDNELEARKRHG